VLIHKNDSYAHSDFKNRTGAVYISSVIYAEIESNFIKMAKVQRHKSI